MAYRKKTPEEKLQEAKDKVASVRAAFDQKLIQAQEQLKSAQAKANAEKEKIRTRQKIIAGAIALEHAATNSEWGFEFWKLLDQTVTKQDQRDTLGLDEWREEHKSRLDFPK